VRLEAYLQASRGCSDRLNTRTPLKPSPSRLGRARSLSSAGRRLCLLRSTLWAMPEKPTLLVPLRSNGNTLLAGGPVNAFRRRLKFASVVYDRILLEGGVLRLSAGPNMSFSAVEPFNPADPPRWQTAAARHAAERQPFVLAMGKEDIPGVPAATMRSMGSSDTTISWVATLYPFADEILDVADWMDFVRFPDLAGSAGRLAYQWTWADERNPALESAVPVRFVRDTVIKNVNRDLALATASGFAATIDPFHQRVVAQRFNDEGWKLQGYVVPILFPAVGDWSWRPSRTCAKTGAWPGSGQSCKRSRRKPSRRPRPGTSRPRPTTCMRSIWRARPR
jgi:hypothetical protein